MAIKDHPLVKRLASFKLAVFSLSAMTVLVFVMTLAQVKLGIFAAKDAYFDTWFLWAKMGSLSIPYFLGGKSIGLLILVNMAAAMLRMPLTWKKFGLWWIHLSLIVLLATSGWISIVSNESQMAIEEGQTAWYSESMHEVEMVILSDVSDNRDQVISVPQNMLRAGQKISLSELPFQMEILRVYSNSRLDMAMPGVQDRDPMRATAGLGPQLNIQKQSVVTRDDYRNLVSLWVRVTQGNKMIGVWALSSGIGAEQPIHLEGSVYRLILRPLRYYNDYGVELQDFQHTQHPGTTIPSHFASQVHVLSPSGEHLQSALIQMNQPLRFRGKTYFQASYGKNDTLTILQVVENPGWLWPYFSSLGILFGLLWHFAVRLFQGRTPRPNPVAAKSSMFPSLVKGLSPFRSEAAFSGRKKTKKNRFFLFLIGLSLVASPVFASLNTGAETIPVVHLGRVKPLDTVARSSLLALNEKQTFKLPDGTKMAAIDWLLAVMYQPVTANAWPVFRIQNHMVLGIFGRPGEENIALSFQDIEPYLTVVEDEAGKALQVEKQSRNTFQREIVRLQQKLIIYQKLKNTVSVEGHPDFNAYVRAYLSKVDVFSPLSAQHTISDGAAGSEDLPDLLRYFRLFRFMGDTAEFLILDTDKPMPFGDHALDMLNTPERATYMTTWLDLQAAYVAGDQSRLREVSSVLSTPKAITNSQRHKIQLEVFLNAKNPLIWAMTLYIGIMLIAAFGWMFPGRRFSRVVFSGLVTAAMIQTVAIGLRMWLSGRPPVTNLYTSAIFVGWIAVLISIWIERRYRDGIGAFVGAAVGFCTLIVAHHLALQGDTLEMMQAVLDSNFWLATHVVTICIGYGATFFAGALAVVYVVRGVFDRGFSEESRKQITGMVYGTICFALVFSFVGTVLGGIWADQSWGRFWGWDPKENGALLIVLWHAVMLHARMGGYIRQRGLMLMAIFGNIITSFSWFGVNLLGIGLHSYGFMEKGFVWLSAFVFSQLLIIWIGSLPLQYWRSFRK
jgi:ABC-type transport system involved in cytochrome c biogenesis permease subunit